jgi:hypothetical protein
MQVKNLRYHMQYRVIKLSKPTILSKNLLYRREKTYDIVCHGLLYRTRFKKHIVYDIVGPYTPTTSYVSI